MTISVTNIGTVANGASTATLALSTAGTPAGALLVLLITEGTPNGPGTSSVTDAASNTYTTVASQEHNPSTSNLFSAIWFKANAAALSNGQSITYHSVDGASSNGVVLGGLYATGVLASSPLDTAVTATTNNVSTNAPSQTSGTPAVAGELFIGQSSWGWNSLTNFSSGSTGWTDVPSNVQESWIGGGSGQGNVGMWGQYQINSGTGTLTYAPSIDTSHSNNIAVIGFKPAPAATAKSSFLPLLGVGQ